MYKIIIYDLLDTVLDTIYYLGHPSQDQIQKLLYKANRIFKTQSKVIVENVKYSDMGDVSK